MRATHINLKIKNYNKRNEREKKGKQNSTEKHMRKINSPSSFIYRITCNFNIMPLNRLLMLDC